MSDPNEGRRAVMHSSYGIEALESNERVFAESDLVVLCVKPQSRLGSFEIMRARQGNTQVLSIVAGALGLLRTVLVIP